MKKVKFFSVMLGIALSTLGAVGFKSEDGTRPAYLEETCTVINNIPDTCQPNNPGNQCVISGQNAWEMVGCHVELNEPF